jgi:hypothetical protein
MVDSVTINHMKGTFNKLDSGDGSHDITFAPDADCSVTDVPPGGPLGRYRVSRQASLEHFMCTTLGLQMTPSDLKEFVNGKGYRGEISAGSCKKYFQD